MEYVADAELMELVRTGDFRAFDELYNRYAERIRKFLFSLTWDQDLADDYLQEVFLRLYRARDRYSPSGKFSTYIYQIAKNYYLNQRRRNRRCHEVSMSHVDRNGRRPFENIRANTRVEPEVHLMEEYRRWRIRQAIRALPQGQQLVFVMSHFENMKYEEIARVLKVPVGTVKSRMFSAVRKLRKTLKEEQQ